MYRGGCVHDPVCNTTQVAGEMDDVQSLKELTTITRIPLCLYSCWGTLEQEPAVWYQQSKIVDR